MSLRFYALVDRAHSWGYAIDFFPEEASWYRRNATDGMKIIGDYATADEAELAIVAALRRGS